VELRRRARLDKRLELAGDVELLEVLERGLDKRELVGQEVAGELFSPCAVARLI
jgi:hypothetical protein